MKTRFVAPAALAATIAFCGCSSTKATTAEEFVKKHAKAYYSRDAKAVAGMTLCAEDLDKVSLSEKIETEIGEVKRDSLIGSLKSQMRKNDRWVKAWEGTQYVSEEDHNSYIRVEVKVGYAYSAIVLVRVGECLKIAPNPSSFE
jgi:hypothetical protein